MVHTVRKHFYSCIDLYYIDFLCTPIFVHTHLPQCAPRFWPICVNMWLGPCSHRQVCAQCSALLSNSESHTCKAYMHTEERHTVMVLS